MKMRKVSFTRSLWAINGAFLSVLASTAVIFTLFYLEHLAQSTRDFLFVVFLTLLGLAVVVCVSISIYAFAQKPKLEQCLNVYAFQIKELVTYFNRKTPNLEIVYQMWAD